MRGLYSPIDKLAAELPRTKGTGAEFMTELSKRPGYKPQEAKDRNLQTLMALPKMERAKFLDQLKMKPAPKVEETTHADSILKNRGLNVDTDTPTKYEEHTLPGGSNYREILMHMPSHEGQHRKFNYPATLHWDNPAVLAHVRAKDRVGPNGEKLLHIEEIQSDWHQQGREHGYANPESLKEFQAAELQHKALRQQLEEAKSKSEYAEHSLGRKEPLFQQPDVRARFEAAKIKHNNEIMDLMPQVMKAQALEQDLQNKLRTAVPDAPFKKNWHELALKKMIHHAAENGYHGIVITPGQEQADRYKLSKHVGMVAYHPEQQRFQAFKPNRETVINETGATPERVAELVGKDVADRLMKAPKVGDHHYLEGEDINIGGEGMKGFYDKMLPSFLNQFGKKYGAKVGQMQMPVEAGIEPGWITKPAAPRNVAVHHFPITPEMREDVTKNGLPLYADGGAIHMNKGGSDNSYRSSLPTNFKASVNFDKGYPTAQVTDGLTTAEFTDGQKVKLSNDDDFRLALDSKWVGFTKNGKLNSAGSAPFVTPTDLEKSQLDTLAKHVANHLKNRNHKKNVFFRFGELPANERSKNHATGKLENGVSVFPADYHRLTDEYFFDDNAGINSDAHMSYPVSGKEPYAVTGKVVGTGSDGEPLLQQIKKLGKLKRTENGYRLESAKRQADKNGLPLYADGGEVEVRPTVKDETIQRKIPEMEAAARALQAGAINRKEYDRVVNKHKPVKPYTFVPKPASDEDADRALIVTKKPHWRGHEQWPAGRKVGLRLDIPAYENHGVWVNSIHDEEGKEENKYPTAYNSVSSVKNATFDAKPEKAVRVATGEQNKTPFARIHGDLHHMTEDEAVEHMKTYLNHPDWVQVGMDPRRHGYFYDRKTMKPVTHSAHVVQIGPLVLAHKPTYGKRKTYADGGDVKPVGYTKEKVTVSPSLDQMRYELISVKHSKKVK